eukprot:CAMPEP_0114522958 /NCGR_PEP_ID=MMETSP0109-20121206/21031_1 /TAXON_ID=29199 /ORGANISM="Chlorarachnion reptans, Strain CCCM449" /LENGTH=187 /DNA_ID=CAMNT_0001704233 /DNA_START=162 /DNA_END=725 /DNA_ORIENTATION=+
MGDAKRGITPTFLWAQTRESVHITVQIVNPENLKHSITDTGLEISGDSADKKHYMLKLEFPHRINTTKSLINLKGRYPRFEIAKANTKIFWNRVAKDKRKFKNFCKVDFNKWQDEDELYDSDEVEKEDETSKPEEKESDGPDAMGLPPAVGGMDQDRVDMMKKAKLDKGRPTDDEDSDDGPLPDLDG